MTYEQLIKAIENKQFKPVYLLHGTEPFFIDRITEAIENHALTESEKAFNQDVVYGKDLDLSALQAWLMQYPMMAERRLVIVKEAAAFTKWKELTPYFENPNPQSILVIAHKGKKFGAGAKAVEKGGGLVFESKPVYDNKLPDWIISYLKSQNRRINPQTAVLLAEYLGNDLAKIVNELDKIHLNIAPDAVIDHATVEKYVGISKNYNAFELQDAIGTRDKRKALRIAQHLAADMRKQPLVLILASLYAFFAKLYVVHQHAGASDAELMAALGVRFRFLVNKYRQAARHFPPREIQRCMSLLRTYDLRAKGLNNGSAGDGELLVELVLSILNAEVHAH